MANFTKKPNGRWQARVSIKGVAHSVGTFDTKKEAAEAAERFEREVKPGLIKPSVEELLQKDIDRYKKLLPEYKNGDRIMIELIIDKLEILKSMQSERKLAEEREMINKLPSFSIF